VSEFQDCPGAIIPDDTPSAISNGLTTTCLQAEPPPAFDCSKYNEPIECNLEYQPCNVKYEPACSDFTDEVNPDGSPIHTEPHWWPKSCDDAYVARLREDYPEITKDMSDYGVKDYYNPHGFDYQAQALWDHTGDASYDYTSVADALLVLFNKFIEMGVSESAIFKLIEDGEQDE